MNFNEASMEHNPFCLNLSTHSSRLLNSNSIEESCPSLLWGTTQEHCSGGPHYSVEPPFDRPPAHLPSLYISVVLQPVLGRLIRGGWHDLWLTIEAFQSNYGQEIGLVSKGQQQQHSGGRQGVVLPLQECLTPCIMWLELQVGVTP